MDNSWHWPAQFVLALFTALVLGVGAAQAKHLGERLLIETPSIAVTTGATTVSTERANSLRVGASPDFNTPQRKPLAVYAVPIRARLALTPLGMRSPGRVDESSALGLYDIQVEQKQLGYIKYSDAPEMVLKYFLVKATWMEAEAACAADDAALYTFDHSAQLDAAMANFYPHLWPWVDLQKPGVDGGSMVCAFLNGPAPGRSSLQWDDCHALHDFICQKPASTSKNSHAQNIRAPPSLGQNILNSTNLDQHIQNPTNITQNTPDSKNLTQNTPDSTSRIQNTPDSTNLTQNTPDSKNLTQNTPDSTSRTQNTPDFTNLTQNTPDSTRLTQNTPDSTSRTQNTPDSTNLTQNTPDSKNLTQNTPDSTSRTQNTPDSTNLTQNTPDSTRLTQNTQDSTSRIQNTPDSTRLTQNTPDSTRRIQNTPDSTNLTQNTPDSTRLTQNTPDSKNFTQNTPDSTNLTQNTPDSTRLTQNTPDSTSRIQNTPDSTNLTQNTPDSNNLTQNTPDSTKLNRKIPDTFDLAPRKTLVTLADFLTAFVVQSQTATSFFNPLIRAVANLSPFLTPAKETQIDTILTQLQDLNFVTMPDIITLITTTPTLPLAEIQRIQRAAELGVDTYNTTKIFLDQYLELLNIIFEDQFPVVALSDHAISFFTIIVSVVRANQTSINPEQVTALQDILSQTRTLIEGALGAFSAVPTNVSTVLNETLGDHPQHQGPSPTRLLLIPALIQDVLAEIDELLHLLRSPASITTGISASSAQRQQSEDIVTKLLTLRARQTETETRVCSMTAQEQEAIAGKLESAQRRLRKVVTDRSVFAQYLTVKSGKQPPIVALLNDTVDVLQPFF